MADDAWTIVSEKPLGTASSTGPAFTPQERADNDIAALQREIQRAQANPNTSPEAKTEQLKILETELLRLINSQQQPATTEESDPFAVDFNKFKREQQAAKPPYGFDVSQDLLTGGAGATAGATVGAIPATKNAIISGAQQVGQAFRGSPASNGVQNWTREMGYNQRGGTTYKQSHMFEQGTRPGAQIRSPMTGETFKPDFRFPKPPIVGPSPLQAAGHVAQTVMSNPIVRGALGAFGVGASGAETAHRVKEGDVPGAALAGTSALGSAASMIPRLGLPGALLSTGATGALALTDRIRNKLAEEAQNPPPERTPEELQNELSNAQRPARIYSPSIRRPQQSRADDISGALLDSLDQQMQQFATAQG
jgi:hypothetical protein